MTLRLTSIHKRFDDKLVLDNLSLEIPQGALAVFVGPSGCGKSTLLRVVAGLESVDGGEITLAGRDLTRLPPQERDVAMVFQSYALYPHLTVFQNIAFPLAVRRLSKAEIEKRVQSVATTLGLGDLLHRLPRQLSGGQRQRVAMARAMIRTPKLFLFDEPLSNLDAALRLSLRAEIALLHRRFGTTTLYVTHDQQEAMALADVLFVLRDGRIEQTGPPLALYDAPDTRFVAEFLGTPAMSFLTVRCTNGQLEGLSRPVPISRFSRSQASGVLALGVRAGELRAVEPGEPGDLGVSVAWVERSGSETLLYAHHQGQPLVVRTDATSSFMPGATLELQITRGYLFDESGRALPR